MLAISKPPYLRWFLAIALVAAAVAWDLNRGATQPVPFAASAIERGAVVDADQIEWRESPVGLLPKTSPEGATALVEIPAGDPITPSVVSTGFTVPDGWWTVPVDTPVTARPGSRALVILDDGSEVSGVVVEPSREDSFGITASGLVAVPNELAALVALASRAGRLTVLYEP